MRETRTLWRVFPWNRAAAPGESFAPAYVRPRQVSGRFDLQDRPLVLYLAESPEHAAGEKLQRYRARTIGKPALLEHGWPLALVSVALSEDAWASVGDLTDPLVLAELGLRPDLVASFDRHVTEDIARRIHDRGFSGLRWWSALTGDWHTTVLFLDRVSPGSLAYGVPEVLTVESPSVREAAAILGIRIAKPSNYFRSTS